jgi:hypothetical protein
MPGIKKNRVLAYYPIPKRKTLSQAIILLGCKTTAYGSE